MPLTYSRLATRVHKGKSVRAGGCSIFALSPQSDKRVSAAQIGAQRVSFPRPRSLCPWPCTATLPAEMASPFSRAGTRRARCLPAQQRGSLILYSRGEGGRVDDCASERDGVGLLMLRAFLLPAFATTCYLESPPPRDGAARSAHAQIYVPMHTTGSSVPTCLPVCRSPPRRIY